MISDVLGPEKVHTLSVEEAITMKAFRVQYLIFLLLLKLLKCIRFLSGYNSVFRFRYFSIYKSLVSNQNKTSLIIKWFDINLFSIYSFSAFAPTSFSSTIIVICKRKTFARLELISNFCLKVRLCHGNKHNIYHCTHRKENVKYCLSALLQWSQLQFVSVYTEWLQNPAPLWYIVAYFTLQHLT